ncbi:hypothetical protein ACIBK9_17370 [Nonomuraea sp. NPDC050227]|uniref:hypothetical protein n=1 Tax=Nonomuraea sp. NPDC050227 TaxID=3364360 RepID=UPI0037942656
MAQRMWVTDLDVDIDRTSVRVANDTGGTDLAMSAATPSQRAYPSGARVSTLTSYTQIGEAWHSTLSQTNMLSAGSSRLPRDLGLQLGQGRLSDDLRSLRPIRTIQFDVVTEGQIALHMPVPFSVPSRKAGSRS